MTRRLTPSDRLFRVPFGLLYLGFLLLLAVPVLIVMTVLYWLVIGARGLGIGRRGVSTASEADAGGPRPQACRSWRRISRTVGRLPYMRRPRRNRAPERRIAT